MSVGLRLGIALIGATAFAQTTATAPLPPIDAHERLKWLAQENFAPGGLLEDAAIGAINTLENSPEEYGPHWSGFAKRTGMVAANFGVKSVMETGLGSIWGEDPRYTPTQGLTFKRRLSHVIAMTFVSRTRSGGTMPAYARFIAIPGTSFLANTWTPDSQAKVSDAAIRAAVGFASRMGENFYKEFISHHH